MAQNDAVSTDILPLVWSSMDSGNGEVVQIEASATEMSCHLRLRSEPFTAGTDKREHSQWFYFGAANVQGRTCCFRIVDADKTSYPSAWHGYWMMATYNRADPSSWFRVPTVYNEEAGWLEARLTATSSMVWLGYFVPYTYEQHQQLISRCQLSEVCSVRSIGQSLQGRPIDLVRVGHGPLQCWAIARQHPGESMAEWWAQGLLSRLISQDAAVAELCAQATLHIVPNMNPDGSVQGHLRTNAVGANLNREWAATGEHEAPSASNSPEVLCVLRELDAVGCDFFLDVHGDEELPHIFLAGTQGIPGWNDRLAALYVGLVEAQQAAFPCFQKVHGYGNDQEGGANLAICADQVAHRFDCLSSTLEMPFKDTLEELHPETGWSAGRSEQLGGSLVEVLNSLAPFLRASFPFERRDCAPFELLGAGDQLPEWALPGY